MRATRVFKHAADVFLVVATLACSQVPTALAQNTQTVETHIGKLGFELGVPTKATVQKLYDDMDFQRAIQCYLWGIPIVGMEEFKQAEQENAGARSGDIVIYDDYRSKGVILTANATTPYISSVINLAEHGPVVIDYPAGATAGLVDDWWDRPITDMGMPGPDKGQGAKFLFVGPGQEPPQAEGYRVFHSRTLSAWFAYRILDTDPDKAKVLLAGVRESTPTASAIIHPSTACSSSSRRANC
jgi:hypothetical protein